MKGSVCPYICCCVWRCICGGWCRSMSCCLCLSFFCLFSAVVFVVFCLCIVLAAALFLLFLLVFIVGIFVVVVVVAAVVVVVAVVVGIVVVPLLQSIFPQQSFLHKLFCNKAPCAVRISNVPRHGLHCFNTNHLSVKRKSDRMHLTKPL